MRTVVCTLVGFLLAGVAASGDEPFCAVLRQAVAAAEAGDRFAAITGADAGLYHETTLELPGARQCAVGPHEYPAAAWRCVMRSEAKYTLALDLQARLVARVAGCLGAGWTAAESRVEGYLKWVELAPADGPARVRVSTTAPDPEQPRSPHRLVVSVLSPHPAAR